MVWYQVLNYIKAQKIYRAYGNSYAAFINATADNSNEENIHLADLKIRFETAVFTLPNKCQQIFRMDRSDLTEQSLPNSSDMVCGTLNLDYYVDNQMVLMDRNKEIN